MRINGTTFPRPDEMTETVWRKQGDQYVLEDQDGRVYARFDSRDAIFTDANPYPERRLDGDGTGCITKPVIPGEWSSDDYEILIIPEDAETPQDILVRREGEDILLVELHRAEKDSSSFAERLDAI
ncbi:hypothetical protein [Haladaptatus halobius]|uniref:hypothetical protein n=1 Tax=Haladaptatus halobius TaxID=2884875 RepID=UPI001D09A20B|nr:hypothetical protein [Haladaptatus halobius]